MRLNLVGRDSNRIPSENRTPEMSVLTIGLHREDDRAKNSNTHTNAWGGGAVIMVLKSRDDVGQIY